MSRWKHHPKWKSLLNSTVNTMPNFDAITRQIVDNAPTNVENTSNVNVENITLSLPNVENYEGLVTKLQNDKRVEDMIGYMFESRLTGGNRLNKYKVRF